ncbi:hypothetical protein D8674_026542 [Pyrus ussuriensis x Pyrus communis]|uniref:Uncharacterized protein n=1 Tax=Pyrus ussuriensis x Pyrus communis TaxID=2448454 RepID=A0A5N5I878_9ROSA|nr:hypothetical protein D8674_026542 [Pyrus ussuriensis x Pyrus communis]
MGGAGWGLGRMSQLIRQCMLVSRSYPTPPPPTTIAATALLALAPTLEAHAMMLTVPESLTFLVTHPLLSARRFHRQPRPIDEGDESASSSTAVGEGVDTELFTNRFTQWKIDLHEYFKRFDDPIDTLSHECPLELATMMERSQVVLEEVASQLTLDTPMEEVPPFEDTCLRIMMDTLDQRLGPRLEKVYRGMGNARHRETGASSSTSTLGQVASLTKKVAELEQQSTHIATREAHIAAQESKMAQIVAALQLSGFNILAATPSPTTSNTQAPTQHSQP